jgi:hypothetical protein
VIIGPSSCPVRPYLRSAGVARLMTDLGITQHNSQYLARVSDAGRLLAWLKLGVPHPALRTPQKRHGTMGVLDP